jgi:hypothetical protein
MSICARIQLTLLLAASIPLLGQQLDKPVGPEDLADAKTAVERSHAAETSQIDDTDRALRVLVGRDTHSSNAEGSLTQARMLRCLSDGDYYRRIGQIYSSAERAADQIIRELEARTNTAPSTAQALQELQQELDETLRREAELRAGATPSSSDELEEQVGLEKKLTETIDVYKSLHTSSNSEQADRMRAMKARFAVMGQNAADLAKIADSMCVAERQVLHCLNQQEQQDKQIQSWSQLLSDGANQDRAVRQIDKKPSPSTLQQPGQLREVHKLDKEHKDE